MLSPVMFAAAVLAGAPSLPPPVPAAAEEENRRPAHDQGKGGLYEPVAEAQVVVEGERVEVPRPFMLAPDPELERRYAPRERRPVNRIVIRF